MNDKTKAIIIKKSDYRENDELLKILTYDYGLLTFVARSSKKITSKSRFSLNFLTEILLEFDFQQNKEIFSIKNVSTIKNYQSEYDFDAYVLTQLIAEIYGYLLESNDNHKQYYQLLLQYYQFLKIDSYLASCYLIAQCLVIEGIKPSVQECAYCGDKQIVAIENSLGFVCRNHSYRGNFINLERLKKFRYINLVDFERLNSLVDLNYDLNDLKLILSFLSEYLDVNFKAIKMLEETKNY